MTPNQIRAIAAVISAVCTFTILTQTDVTVPALLRYALGAVVIALAAIDWGAFGATPQN